jgi:hypothetical protein
MTVRERIEAGVMTAGIVALLYGTPHFVFGETDSVKMYQGLVPGLVGSGLFLTGFGSFAHSTISVYRRREEEAVAEHAEMLYQSLFGGLSSEEDREMREVIWGEPSVDDIISEVSTHYPEKNPERTVLTTVVEISEDGNRVLVEYENGIVKIPVYDPEADMFHKITQWIHKD